MDGMKEYKGKIVLITDIENDFVYRIDADDGCWNWSYGMFEKKKMTYDGLL